jgi:hypothetical protein
MTRHGHLKDCLGRFSPTTEQPHSPHEKVKLCVMGQRDPFTMAIYALLASLLTGALALAREIPLPTATTSRA